MFFTRTERRAAALLCYAFSSNQGDMVSHCSDTLFFACLHGRGPEARTGVP